MFCYIDLDVDDSRGAYKRACDFVDKNSIKYGLSTNILQELGGREKLSIPELVENDYTYSSKGRVQTQPQKACRLVFELQPKDSPLAVENFVALCTGVKGKSKSSGLPLHYLGSQIHRYVPGFIMQGGDIIFSNGTGGESIWGKKFKDDPKGLKLRHSKRGILSMGNGGKNSNTSQWFITLDNETKTCDGKHVVFGQLIHGFDVLDLVQKLIQSRGGVTADEVPPFSITVTSCGEWTPDVDAASGYWAEDDLFKQFVKSSFS